MVDQNAMRGFRVGRAIVDPMRNCMTTGKKSRKIRPREMDVLLHLIQSESAVASRQEIMDSVWTDVIVNDDALTLAISRIRRALADNPKRPEYIETIPKRGYRLVADTREINPRDVVGAHRGVRRYRFGVAILALLLAFVTAMFITVRTEYGKVSMPDALVETTSEEVSN